MNIKQLNEQKSCDSHPECDKTKDKHANIHNDDMLYYEFGAHFSYTTLCLKLEEYLATTTSLRISEKDLKLVKAHNIFNISLCNKSRNINLNHNVRLNNLHINNPRKGITLLFNNKSNNTLLTLKPNCNNKPNDNFNKHKGAINLQQQPIQPVIQQQRQQKNGTNRKDVTEKKSERVAYSTSHPKKNILNNKKEKDGPNINNNKNCKSNPIAPRKTNINPTIGNTHIKPKQQDIIKPVNSTMRKKPQIQSINVNINIKNVQVNKSTSLSKEKDIDKVKAKDKEKDEEKRKDKKANNIKTHSANIKNKQSTKSNSNFVLVAPSKNQIKSIETHPLQYKESKSKEKSRNNNSEEENKDQTKHSMTFSNLDQNIIKPIAKRDISKKPHSLEKPSTSPPSKDNKFLNINMKKQNEQYYPFTKKHFAEVKVNLSSNQNSPSISKGKIIHQNTNITVDLPPKKNLINKNSSRNMSTNKHSMMNTTAKPILNTKRITKEKTNTNRLLTSTTEYTSAAKVSTGITTTNYSPKDKLLPNKKVDSNSKLKTKSNSVTSNGSKGNMNNVASKQQFIKCTHNSVVKKAQFVTVVQLNKKK